MAKRWFVSPVLGTGVKGDYYRSKFSGMAGVDVDTNIPRNPDGTPKFNWCVCLVKAVDFTAIDADATIDGFPGVSLDDQLGTFSAAVRNKIQTALVNHGVDLTGITLTNTVRDVLQRAGQALGAGWDCSRIDLP